MRRILFATFIIILAVVGLGAPASAAPVERPFKATFTGGTTDITYAPGFDFATNPTATSTFGGRCPGGASWLITQGGAGHGTFLGAIRWTSTHCTLLTSLSPPNAVIFAGRLQFTAANGDLLYEDYHGVGGLFLNGDSLCGDTAATFAGGTGRFTAATGSALEHGCWPASIQGPVITGLVISSSGRITFDASDRS